MKIKIGTVESENPHAQSFKLPTLTEAPIVQLAGQMRVRFRKRKEDLSGESEREESEDTAPSLLRFEDAQHI